jgi:hypothetical protein
MGRFEGRQIVKIKSTTYRTARCRIQRGWDAWIVMHRSRIVGKTDTYVEAETLARRESGRLDAIREATEALAAEQTFERQAQECAEARHNGTSAIGFDEYERCITGVGHTGPWHDDDAREIEVGYECTEFEF